MREGVYSSTTFSTVSWCHLGSAISGSQPFHTELGYSRVWVGLKKRFVNLTEMSMGFARSILKVLS
jgi:hypothetical protein